MNKKNKRLVVAGLLLLFSIVALALGLKYLPFTKLVRMPVQPEKEFVNPGTINGVSPHTLYFDFEVAPGNPVPEGFYKGIAHSGQYSVKAFGQNSFSTAVERTIGDIGAENLKAVALSAWIYVFPTSTNVKGSFVFTASNEVGVNVCWHGIGITEPEIPRGKWFKISKYFDLTSVEFKPGYKLQVYFWNNSSTDILIDDYFIVFGAAVDRRGDSARVDMTGPSGYIPKFNYPPFPVSFLEKVPLERTIDPVEIEPGDFAIAGDFFNTATDGLLVVGKNGRMGAFACCPEKSGFRKIILNDPSALSVIAPVKKIVKGKFLSARGEQLIVMGEKGWLLCSLDPPENLCSNAGGGQGALRIIWKSGEHAGSVFAGDLTGDRRSEILVVSDDGSWTVKSFDSGLKSGGVWKDVADGHEKPVDEWVRGDGDMSISSGRFVPGVANDVILTVKRNKRDGKCTYSLRRLNAPGKNWEPLFKGRQDNHGRTVGLDTLKPEDIFFTLTGAGNKITVFRYNRDWRYDLKEIRFNDTTFAIVSGIDFTGFELDRNPKYYESLKLVPGCFLKASSHSILAIGHINESRHYKSILPDFVHLYTLPETK